ncbi:MAG: aldehyde ferredoxin oxidoreductase N-terminal domain-containing protein, partial [Nitrososphaerota archaeon]
MEASDLRGWKGLTGKLLRINLSTRKIMIEEIPFSWVQRYLGGRGLAARYYYEEVGPDVDPLSP